VRLRLPWSPLPRFPHAPSRASSRAEPRESGTTDRRAIARRLYRKEGVWGSYNAPVFKPVIHGLPHLRRRRRGTEGIVVYHSWHEGPRVGPARSNAAGEGDPSMKAEAHPFKGGRRSQ